MFCSLNSRRAVWSTVVVLGSFCILSGCKHVYRGRGVESSVSGPYIQPHDSEPLLDTPALHEPLPELSPVPPLPESGHSVPPEPLPSPIPPAPSEPTSAETESGNRSVTQTKSFWTQMSARLSTSRTIQASPLPIVRQGRHAAVASGATSNPAMVTHPANAIHGGSLSKLEANSIASRNDEVSGKHFHMPGNLASENSNRSVESVSNSTLPGSLSVTVARSARPEVVVGGPVIVPMQQPIAVRNGVIENWPYRSQPSTLAADVRTNNSLPLTGEVQTAPANETQSGSIEPPPAAERVEPTVPSLLPPGP